MNGVVTFICFWTVLCPLIVPMTAQNITNNGVQSVFSAVTKLLDFLKNNYQGMTLDTVFGLRVIEGQCKLLVEEHEKGQLEFVAQKVIKQISELGVDAGKLANMALPHTLEQDREYFGLMKQLTVGPWKVFHPHRVVNPSLRWNYPLNPPDFSELDADRCTGELMGGTKQNKNLCKLTEDCLYKMLSPGQIGYQLQRQIFYSIVAKKMDCESQVNDYLVARTNYKNLDQVQHSFCTNAYYELEESTATHGLIDEYRDLFLESEFICPSIGYFQFMRSNWLDAIISWQSEEGCFPKTIKNADGSSKISSSSSRSQPNIIQQEHPNIPPPPNFHQPRAKPILSRGSLKYNDSVQSPDDEAPQWVTLASPNIAQVHRAPSNHHISSIDNLPPIQVPVYSLVPEQRNNYVLANSMQQQQLQQQQHYDIPLIMHNSKQNPSYGIQNYPNHAMRAGNFPQVHNDNKFQEAMQVQQPNYAWNNDIAYAPFENHIDDPHNLPQVVPHHNRIQYESGQGVHPQHYGNANNYNANGQQQVLQNNRGNSNPYLREYHLNRGLKSVNLMATNHLSVPAKPMRERTLAGGCLSHLTSMASAALAMYLRYLIDPGPPEFVHLRLENYLRHNAALKVKSSPRVEVLNGENHLQVKINPAASEGNVLPSQTGPLGGNVQHVESGNKLNTNVHAHHMSMVNESPLGSNNGVSAEHNQQGKINDMMSQAWNFMGTYQRKFGPRFQPIYAGNSANKGVGMVPDYIHRAEVNKVLPDWTVALKESQLKVTTLHSGNVQANIKGNELESNVKKSATESKRKMDLTVSTAAAWVRHKDVNQRKKEILQNRNALWQKMANPRDIVKERQMEVHIIEIQSPLQRDLDHYLIAVILVSVICLFVLFRYFRQRRNIIRGKTRNF